MLKIGDFSKLSRISIRMLRHYDETGLLKPVEVDRFTGYRYYLPGQLSDAARITMLKNMGFALAVIPDILSKYKDVEELKKYLSVRYSEMLEQSVLLSGQLKIIESALDRLGKDKDAMKYDVNLKEIPKRYVASVRRVIPSYNSEGMLWGIMMEDTKGLDMQVANPSDSLAVFHDKSFKESGVDVEIQMTVTGKYSDTENVKFKTIEPVLVASSVYKGSYSLLTEVNGAVAYWVESNGYEYSGPMFCIYHVSPAFEQNPDNYVTEVCFPVKKKA